MKILLTTLHAKYAHASLALPSLAACCRDLPGVELTIRELTINEPHEQQLRQLIAQQADLIGFSCYIWNIERTLRLVSDIKKIAPRTIIVLGGPEVSSSVFELMQQQPAIDYVVRGEGETVFTRLVSSLLNGAAEREKIANLFFRDGDEIITGQMGHGECQLDTLVSPFQAGLVNFDKPLTYYETSRGCPFSCAFCLSSVEGTVRSYSLDRIKRDLAFLMERATPQIKLVDRTFNYDSRRADEIWRFILEHNRGSHFHFEIAADLLTDSNLQLLRQVPADCFRFEIGIQSSFEETLAQVNRTADLERIYAAIRRLRAETAVELHLDLVAGLPGETYGMFLQSLQTVAGLHPHQIQVEPLKLLKGTSMRGIARQEQYAYSDFPPYMILQTPWLSFHEIGRIETVGRLLDLFHNSGKFSATLRYLTPRIPLATLLDRMADSADLQKLHSLSTPRLFESFYQLALPLVAEAEQADLEDALCYDYCRTEMPRAGKLPSFMAPRQDQCAWPNRKEISGQIKIPENCRVTLFRFPFRHDYRQVAGLDQPVELTMAYLSAPAGGLQVVVCPKN